MARRGPQQGWDPWADSPPLVQITIVPGPPGRSLRGRLSATGATLRRGLIALLALAVVAAGAILWVVLSAPGPGRDAGGRAPPLRDPGAAGVAAAYNYPLRCLNVTVSPGYPSYARAELNRASPCWRFGGYVTAVFHREHGIWRPAIDASRYSCPIGSLPAVVQRELALCPRAR